MPRASIALLIVLLGLAACGDSLGTVGDISREFVHGDEVATTSTSVAPGPTVDLIPITDLVWVNDELGFDLDLEAEDVLRLVWNRGDGVNPFVQSSRREIATALPDIQFPRLAPQGITHVTSQLVFDTQTASLDVSGSAAFGMWTAEPYTVPRVEAQLIVLRVGQTTFDGAVATDSDIASFIVTDGRELAWTAGDYVYQLFCRTGISEASCFAIAESLSELALLATLPPPDTSAPTDTDPAG